MNEPAPSAAEVWQTAQGELQLQLPRETFDTWLRSARLIAYEDGTYIIGAHNAYARDWLEERLKGLLVETIGRIARRGVEVRLVVAPKKRPADAHGGEYGAELADEAPLLAGLQAQGAPQPAGLAERRSSGLNPQHSFASFATGECNRLAHAAALAVAASPAAQFNPLFIHAGVGLGKTHLLQAIGNACLDQGRRVRYITSETFTNELVAAIRNKSTSEFRDRYREVDVLLVDDVQFLAGKETSQEEFYHTFNALQLANAQIVLTASAPPAEIPSLDSRLVSRFAGGLVVELEAPDGSTRLDILETKAALRSPVGDIPLGVLQQIAEDVEGNVRELEGALNRVVVTMLLTQEVPTLDETRAVLEKLPVATHGARELSLAEIVQAVADACGVTPEAVRGRSRKREISMARQIVMYIAHEKAGLTFQAIGEGLDGRNHSTVSYGCKRVAELMASDAKLRRQVAAVRRALAPQQDIIARLPA